jgi:Mg2+ and Co2+ transporter CorA
MNTEQLFNNIRSIREQFQSLFSHQDSKAKLERINDAIKREASRKAELQDILNAKSKLQDARSANRSLRDRIKDIDKPTTKWKPTRSDNV